MGDILGYFISYVLKAAHFIVLVCYIRIIRIDKLLSFVCSVVFIRYYSIARIRCALYAVLVVILVVDGACL